MAHDPTESKSSPVRALSRGLAVLQAINRGPSLTMMEIARAAQVPYPTASRLVQTLLLEGLVEQEPDRKRYRPTALVQTLSNGYMGDAHMTRLARQHIVALTRRLKWPITLTSRVGHSIVIRDSTHSLTTLTFNAYYPGYAMPVLESAAGVAILSFMNDVERAELFSSMERLPAVVDNPVYDLFLHEGLAEETRERGYAVRAFNMFTANPGKTSSIAVPILQDGQPVGALTLAFFANAVRMQDAEREFPPHMVETAALIAADLRTSEHQRIARF
jgi:IclR family transcriptional regulator, mhp operon transcriptional activator